MARSKTCYTIDGLTYKSKKDVERHKLLKANPSVKSFKLPTPKEKSTYSRYGAHKMSINDIVFDSIMEGMYYAHLLDLKKAKKIREIERQIHYTLQEKFTHEPSGKKLRAIEYIADFVITNIDGTKLVVDTKGKKTPEFKIKEKMLLFKYPDINFMCVQFDEIVKEWRNLDDIEKDRRARKRTRKKTVK